MYARFVDRVRLCNSQKLRKSCKMVHTSCRTGAFGSHDTAGFEYCQNTCHRSLLCVFLNQNHPEALYNLGLMYAYDRGVGKDYTQAALLFEKVHAGLLDRMF